MLINKERNSDIIFRMKMKANLYFSELADYDFHSLQATAKEHAVSTLLIAPFLSLSSILQMEAVILSET
jgi:hypothetical protein